MSAQQQLIKEIRHFIGKEDKDIERYFCFTHYTELKDRTAIGGKQHDHACVVDAFFAFLNNIPEIIVIKTDNGEVTEFFSMESSVVKEELLKLDYDLGQFFDEEDCISYAFLTETCFAYVLKNMLFFSTTKQHMERMVTILNQRNMIYWEPEEPESEKHKKSLEKFAEKYITPLFSVPQQAQKKTGRNELCPCNSGKKYKKCCLNS